MAVLESSELPGRESTMDWAFFLGSSAGTLEALRAPATEAEKAGRARRARVGRRRLAPVSIEREDLCVSQVH